MSLILSAEMEVATKYQSHLPALLACIGATVGDVLEVGMGHFSTPQLHALCGAMDRKLVSLEEDKEWLRFFNIMLGDSTHHSFCLGEYETTIVWMATRQEWSVSFIDHSPGGENRANAFRALIGRSQYVVVHDYWQDNEEAIAPLLKDLHHHVMRTYEPPTLIAAKNKNIPRVLVKL